jgi:hypothetical protein
MKCYCCLQELVGSESHYGLHPECFAEWFEGDSPSDRLEFQQVVAQSTLEQPSDKFSRINSSFFHGKFRKYSAELGVHSYILKVQQVEYPELPQCEYLCNQIARVLGIQNADFFLVDFGERPTFVTRNFINPEKSQNLIHIYHYFSEESRYSCEECIQILREQCGRLEDIERFIALTLFDALIGNHDRHGRNLALIETPKGKRLSPFYDNHSYLALEEDGLLGMQHSPRGKIATARTLEPTMKDYVREFSASGYEEAVRGFQQKVDLNQIESLVQQSFISVKRKDALIRLISERYHEI